MSAATSTAGHSRGAPAAPARGRSRARTVAWIAAAVVALNVGLLLLDAARPTPSGPRSSAFATAPEGLAAYADLLRRRGHPVRALRAAPGERRLDPRATAVLLDPDAVLPADVEALRRFLDSGGRLVAGGRAPDAWLRRLVPAARPRWGPDAPRTASPLAPAPELAGVARVATAGEGGFERAGGALPVLAGDGPALALAAEVGAGRLVALADASPLQNRLLGAEDNAALGAALAGERGRPVHFVESVHGYGEERGLGALPGNWQLALLGLTLAALVWLVARGRRLGPPERAARDLPPPRRAYADAIGAALARTRRPREAVAPAREAARRRVAARAGLAPGAGDEDLARAAERLGLPPEEVRAIAGRPADGEDETMAVGRALARLAAAGRRREGAR